MKYRRRYRPRRPQIPNPIGWLLKLLWRGIVILWERQFSPIPYLKPGERPTKAHTDAFYKTRAWKNLSYATKRRYGARCMLCRSEGGPDNPIVTDHIKSLRHYWHLRLDPANMQVLCTECNLGKGSRDSTDYRALSQRNHPRWWLRKLVFGEPRP